eukprot:jgi/Ulvmu1/6281/UM028_0141.1
MYHLDVPAEAAAGGAAAVAALTQLQDLSIVAEMCTDSTIRYDSADDAAAAGHKANALVLAHAQQYPMAAAVQQPALLTSLDLQFMSMANLKYGLNELSKAMVRAARVLSSLSSLRQLRRLFCELPIEKNSEENLPCTGLAWALPAMTELSKLGFRAGLSDWFRNKLLDPGLASLVAVVWAAVRRPPLRVLHVPVSAVQEGGRFVAALPAAAHISNLTIDLFVRARGKVPDHWQQSSTCKFATRGTFDPWLPVQGFRHLRFLTVDVDQGQITAEDSEVVAATVAALTQLEQLTFVVQMCTHSDSDHDAEAGRPDAPAHLQQNALAASMQQLSLLTSLDLEFSSTAIDSVDELSKVQAGAATLLASLSSLRLLRRLSCKVPIRRDHAEADPPCTALAGVLLSLAQLTQLELRAGHTDRYNTEGGQLVATLLAATHISHLTFDLFVHAMGEGQDEPWQHGVDVYVPLFPNVTALSVWAHGAEESLWPILSHVTALQQLRTLTIEATGCKWWSSANREQAQSMGGIRGLSQLTRLTCLYLLLDSFSDPIDTQSLTQAVAGMQSLQHLTWDVVSLNEAVLITNELLEAFLRMPGLRVLNMGEFQVSQADMCMKVLPQLRLAELEVQIRLDRDVQPLAGLVQGLRHLRCLAMPECRVEGVERAMRGATAALSSFEELICSPYAT